MVSPESIQSIMSTAIPTCSPSDSYKNILEIISHKSWRSIDRVYVLDEHEKLLGVVDMTAVIQSDTSAKAKEIMQPIKFSLHPDADQEEAVFLAVRNDMVSIPVVDKNGAFVGAVSARTIIDIMHDEHIEDTFLKAGIHGKGSDIPRVASRIELIVVSRLPWLIVGLLAGLGLGMISSTFEESLSKTVALAYFIPVVAYIADSVGTQSEAIAVRALALTKVNYATYLLKEFFVGGTLGIIVGILGGLGAMLISHSTSIGIVVALSLVVASTVASVLASLIPIVFKALGKDPALGSGPLSTALQDVISVLVYFLFAVSLIH